MERTFDGSGDNGGARIPMPLWVATPWQSLIYVRRHELGTPGKPLSFQALAARSRGDTDDYSLNKSTLHRWQQGDGLAVEPSEGQLIALTRALDVSLKTVRRALAATLAPAPAAGAAPSDREAALDWWIDIWRRAYAMGPDSYRIITWAVDRMAGSRAAAASAADASMIVWVTARLLGGKAASAASPEKLEPDQSIVYDDDAARKLFLGLARANPAWLTAARRQVERVADYDYLARSLPGSEADGEQEDATGDRGVPFEAPPVEHGESGVSGPPVAGEDPVDENLDLDR